MAKKTKEDFLMQAIETAVSMAAQSTERIAVLLPADIFAAAQPEAQAPVQPDPLDVPVQHLPRRRDNPGLDNLIF